MDPRPFEREFEGIQRFEPISRSHASQLAILHVGKNDVAGCFYYVMELADAVETPKTEGRNPKETRNPISEAKDDRENIPESSFGVPLDFGLRPSDAITLCYLPPCKDMAKRWRKGEDSNLRYGYPYA